MNRMILTTIAASCLVLAACGGSKRSAKGPERDEAVDAIRKRAAFDLSCAEEQIKVIRLQEGSMLTVASYGAACGEKRATYLERTGTILRQ